MCLGFLEEVETRGGLDSHRIDGIHRSTRCMQLKPGTTNRNSFLKQGVPSMRPNLELERLTTSVLLVDGNNTDRTYYADQLKGCSHDYEIVEATDGRSGLALYRSRSIDCVVLEIDLPDRLGCQVLLELVPRVSRPKVAVIVLTHLAHRGVVEMVRQNGAYACFVKKLTSGEDLDRAIQRSVALAGLLPKEDRGGPGWLDRMLLFYS